MTYLQHYLWYFLRIILLYSNRLSYNIFFDANLEPRVISTYSSKVLATRRVFNSQRRNLSFPYQLQDLFILSWPVLSPIYPFMTVSDFHLSFPEKSWDPFILFWRVMRPTYPFMTFLNPIYPFLKASQTHLSFNESFWTHLVSSLKEIWNIFLDTTVHWAYRKLTSPMCRGMERVEPYLRVSFKSKIIY